MKKRTIWITSATAAGVLALGGTAIAYAATDGFETDDDRTGTSQGTERSDDLTGADLEQATDAALAETGGGEVVDAENEDDREGDRAVAYEVDVKLDSGKYVEVSLDENFDVVTVEDDDTDDADDADGDD
jgi:uncharacterized membrane protein YkoI